MNEQIKPQTNILSQHQHQQQKSKHPKQQQQQRRLILPEETYTTTLSTIISRDYYPALPSLRRDAAVLHCRSIGDVAGAVAVRRAARKLYLHEENLKEKERTDEEEAVRERGGVRKRPRPLERESVEGIHMRVTSEDNAEFERVVERERREKRDRIDIVYNSIGLDRKRVGHQSSGDVLDVCDTVGPFVS